MEVFGTIVAIGSIATALLKAAEKLRDLKKSMRYAKVELDVLHAEIKQFSRVLLEFEETFGETKVSLGARSDGQNQSTILGQNQSTIRGQNQSTIRGQNQSTIRGQNQSTIRRHWRHANVLESQVLKLLERLEPLRDTSSWGNIISRLHAHYIWKGLLPMFNLFKWRIVSHKSSLLILTGLANLRVMKQLLNELLRENRPPDEIRRLEQRM
jgi:hypothetical protein